MIILKDNSLYNSEFYTRNLNSNMIILKVKWNFKSKLWLGVFKFQYDNT